MVHDEPAGPHGPVDPADRLAAAELLARYAELIDDGDLDGLGGLFADAVLEGPDGTALARGAAAATALYRATTRLHDDGTPRTAHLVTNVVVASTPDPDEVEVRSRFCVLQATGSVPLQPVAAGRYVDRLRRDGPAGPWRFARRRMVPELWGDVSDHLLGAADYGHPGHPRRSTMPLSPDDPVERLVSGPPLAVHADDTLLRIAELIIEDSVGAVVVRGTGGPAGIVSERDIVGAVVEGLDLEADRAADVMAMEVVTIDAAEPISAAASMMLAGAVRHLPVVADGALVGVVSMRDVLGVYAG